MRNYTIRLAVFTFAFISGICIADKRIPAPSGTDFVGAWVGLADNGAAWRIELLTNGTGLVLRHEEQTDAHSTWVESLDVYDITEWKVVPRRTNHWCDVQLTVKPRDEKLGATTVVVEDWTAGSGYRVNRIMIEITDRKSGVAQRQIFFREEEILRRISTIRDAHQRWKH